MYSKRELLDLLLGTRIWIAVFLAGILAGILFYSQVYDLIYPLLKNTVALAEKPASLSSVSESVYLLFLYFFKNALVIVLCLITTRPSRGLIPGLVLTINGLVLGFAATLIHNLTGLSYGLFALGILPHGIFEFTALFLACAAGWQAVSYRKAWRFIWLPLSLLAVAAVIEAFVSPWVIKSLV
ncbi:MAG: stage II sporulation protein M [Syntrophomonas sp.]